MLYTSLLFSLILSLNVSHIYLCNFLKKGVDVRNQMESRNFSMNQESNKEVINIASRQPTQTKLLRNLSMEGNNIIFNKLEFSCFNYLNSPLLEYTHKKWQISMETIYTISFPFSIWYILLTYVITAWAGQVGRDQWKEWKGLSRNNRRAHRTTGIKK